jgi:hypothetical protein
MLIHLYAVGSQPAGIKLDAENGHLNGHVRLPNGHAHENGHIVRDAEEFELHGLTSDDEDEGAGDTDPLVANKEGRRIN